METALQLELWQQDVAPKKIKRGTNKLQQCKRLDETLNIWHYVIEYKYL